MVRLQTSVHGSSDSGGAHPLVEHLLANTATGNKRSRTSGNSLHYKVSGPGRRSGGFVDTNSDNIVIPPKGLPYEKPRQQQRKENERPKVVTRARGSGGIPPKKSKLELLSELQGMSEEQIMQALYADPELAGVASEQIARAQQKKMKANDPSQNQKPNSSSGNNNKHKTYKRGIADRVDAATKERGIPYEQWAVLLLLTGIGLYQLYKSITGNSPTLLSDRSGHKNNAKKDLSTSNKKAKGKKIPKIKLSHSEKTDDVDKVVAEIEGIKDAVESASKATTVKRTVGKSKKKLSNSSKEHTNKEKTINTVAKANIIVDSNGESSAQSKVVAPPVHSTRRVINADDYTTDDDLPLDDEWKTVSKSKTNSKTDVVQQTKSAQHPKKEHIKDLAPKKENDHLAESVAETTATIETETNGEGSSAMQDSDVNKSNNQQLKTDVPITDEDQSFVPIPEQSSEAAGASTENKKLKKKKKKVAVTNKAELNGKTNHSDDTVAADAALALHLQQEEERLALTLQNQTEGSLFLASTEGKDDNDGDTDAWEEVSTKKKK